MLLYQRLEPNESVTVMLTDLTRSKCVTHWVETTKNDFPRWLILGIMRDFDNMNFTYRWFWISLNILMTAHNITMNNELMNRADNTIWYLENESISCSLSRSSRFDLNPLLFWIKGNIFLETPVFSWQKKKLLMNGYSISIDHVRSCKKHLDSGS